MEKKIKSSDISIIKLTGESGFEGRVGEGRPGDEIQDCEGQAPDVCRNDHFTQQL